jgi:hypothetical protein
MERRTSSRLVEKRKKKEKALELALPPEILLLVMKRLRHSSCFATLSFFASASWQCLRLALPLLINDIDLGDPGHHFDARKALAFSKDALGTDKFRFVETLSVDANIGLQAVSEIMAKCATYVKVLLADMDDGLVAAEI